MEGGKGREMKGEGGGEWEGEWEGEEGGPELSRMFLLLLTLSFVVRGHVPPPPLFSVYIIRRM